MPVPLKSGDAWTGTLSDAFLVFSLLMLMFEFIKSARHGKSLVEHFLSLLLAGGTAAEFWMLPRFGNSIFLLFVAICFVDLFAGLAASLRRARRAVVVAQRQLWSSLHGSSRFGRSLPGSSRPIRSPRHPCPGPSRSSSSPCKSPGRRLTSALPPRCLPR